MAARSSWDHAKPNKSGRATVVLHPPDPKNSYYGPYYDDIAEFMLAFAKKILERDNLVMLTHRKNFPEFDSELPQGVCLPSTVEDIWMRDFTTAVMSSPVKFRFLPSYLSPTQARYFQGSFVASMKEYGITPYEKSSDLIIDGGGIVDNDTDTVIITSRVEKDNPDVDIRSALRDLFNYDNVVILDELEGDTTGHADGMVSFIDTNVVAMSQLEKRENERIYTQLRHQLPKYIKIVELPNNYRDETWRGFSSACGLHINSLVTDDYIYVPTFGHDRENRRRGTHPRDDEVALEVIRKNTRKTVVPVPVPHKICRMGGNLRCLSWQIKGSIADQLVKAAEDFSKQRGK